MLKIQIILGSTRPGRFSAELLPWLKEAVNETAGFTYEVLDLRDYALPFYDSSISAASVKDGQYTNAEVHRFAAKIAEADAYVIVAPEYNHGYTAVLKNALDSIYAEWNNKAVGFIAYGSVGGGRVVEQLRQVAIELQLAPIRNAVHIQAPWLLRDEAGKLKDGVLDAYTGSLQNMLAQLQWWGKALQTARNAS